MCHRCPVRRPCTAVPPRRRRARGPPPSCHPWTARSPSRMLAAENTWRCSLRQASSGPHARAPPRRGLVVRRHAAPRCRGSPVCRGPLPRQSADERERESGCVREKGVNVIVPSRTASTRCAIAVEGRLVTEGYRHLHASCRRERES
jgi:hypothetical protein